MDTDKLRSAKWPIFVRILALPLSEAECTVSGGHAKTPVQAAIPFRAIVADNFYGEDRSLRKAFRALRLGYVLALKPSPDWWHEIGTPGSLKEVAQAADWKSAEQPGQWVKVERTFRDGSKQTWWALEVQAGPYGPDKTERAVIATTDPVTLPDLSTWYLVTNLSAPASPAAEQSTLLAASLEEVIRLYGLRMWIEQSYKQVRGTLGWSQYQVRSDRAMRRHWQLVCCAFSFCWYHHSHSLSDQIQLPESGWCQTASPQEQAPEIVSGVGKKNRRSKSAVLTRVINCGEKELRKREQEEKDK